MTFSGPLRRNPANPRYFTDASGEPIYLTGSHTWAVMQDMWLENEPRRNVDYTGFLQMMLEHGHSFMRFWQFALYSKNCPWNRIPTCWDPLPFERTGPGVANDGLPKFDLATFNQAYFDRLRSRIEQAAELGIYASIMLFEAWALKWATPDQQPWETHVFNPTNNVNGITDDPIARDGQYAGNAIGVFSMDCPQILTVQKALVRKVIDTVNDLDNVLYEVCNEIPNTDEARAWQSHLCDYVRAYEATKPNQHPIGITAEGADQVHADLVATTADWISPSADAGFLYRYNPPAADGEKVIITDTDHMWGTGCEVGWIWKSLCRGMNVILMDPWEPIPGDLDWWQDGDITLNQRYHYIWDDARRNLGYARKVALQFDLNALVPDLVFCTSTYCLADRNQQYVCFFPAGGYEGLDLTGLDGEFSVGWLNPTTGITTPGEPLSTEKEYPEATYRRAALRAPFDGPAVLLLYKHRRELPRKHEIYVSD